MYKAEFNLGKFQKLSALTFTYLLVNFIPTGNWFCHSLSVPNKKDSAFPTTDTRVIIMTLVLIGKQKYER